MRGCCTQHIDSLLYATITCSTLDCVHWLGLAPQYCSLQLCIGILARPCSSLRDIGHRSPLINFPRPSALSLDSALILVFGFAPRLHQVAVLLSLCPRLLPFFLLALAPCPSPYFWLVALPTAYFSLSNSAQELH